MEELERLKQGIDSLAELQGTREELERAVHALHSDLRSALAALHVGFALLISNSLD
jgi:hypothetical protein